MDDVREKVLATIRDVVRPNRPDLSQHDTALLGSTLDSLDFATVLMALEDEFGVTLADEDTETLGTINKMAAFIEARQKAKS